MNGERVALFIPHLTGGGAERKVSNLSLHLSKKGISVSLLLYDTSKVDYPWEGEIVDLGYTPAPGDNPISKMGKIYTCISKVRKLKRNSKLDATVSFLTGPNIFNIFSRGHGKTIITACSHMSSELRFAGPRGIMDSLMIRRFYGKADLIVSVSRSVKDDLVENFGLDSERIKVIYNPIDIDRIRTLSKEELEGRFQDIFDAGPVVINVGRLVEPKGQWHLIKAFNKVSSEMPDAQLIILGEGQMRDRLTTLARSLGLENNVHILGFQNNPFKFMARSELFVLSSLWEGLGNTTLESMACGTPVLTTDCSGGSREILSPDSIGDQSVEDIEHGEYGFLTPPLEGIDYFNASTFTRNESILAEGILGILQDDHLKKKYSQASVRRVQCFDASAIASEWIKVMIG